MKCLLDSHTLLWYTTEDARLSPIANEIISDGENQIFVSPATYWEIALKISLGKYPLSVPFADFFHHAIDDNGFQILPINVKHAAGLLMLPYHHRDPFDRMLVAQAMVESIQQGSQYSAFCSRHLRLDRRFREPQINADGRR